MNMNLRMVSKLKELTTIVLCASLLTLAACSEDPEVEDPTLEPEEEVEEEESLYEDLPDSDAFNALFAEENDTIMYDTSEYATGSYTRTLYVDADSGSDSNDGTSESKPLKSLDQLNTMIQSGDEILLKGSTSSEHKGTIILNGVSNVRVGSYGSCKARINAEGRMSGVLVYGDSSNETFSGFTISDLKITADGYSASWGYGTGDDDYKYQSDDFPVAPDYYNSYYNLLSRYGILVCAGTRTTLSDLVMYNVDIADIFYYNPEDTHYTTMANRPCREWSTSYEKEYGYGIRMYSASNAVIDNTKIDNCNIREVSHTGIKSNNSGTVTNLHITKTNIYDTGGPGAQFNAVYNGQMDYCQTLRPGSSTEDGVLSTRKWGRGSGMWLHTCDGFLFDHNYYYGSEGVADCCGAHIDIGNKNVVIQYCLSVSNCGGFVEVLGNNYNCCYRYNVSIDDGWRDISDAAQYDFWYGPTGSTVGSDGCLLTVNGHTTDYFEGPYYTYVYNNTVISSESRYDGYTNPYIFEIATSAEGVLIANNIFYTPLAEGQQYGVSYSTHSYDSSTGEFSESAVDYKIGTLSGTTATTRYLYTDEMEVLNHQMKNNVYLTYDEEEHGSKYKYAENIHYNNDNPHYPDYTGSSFAWPYYAEARYRDLAPLGGDPVFTSFTSGQDPINYKVEAAIPRDAAIINRGITIEKLSNDNTSYGVSYRRSSESFSEPLNLDVDILGNPITTPIMGACVVQ